MHPNGTPMTKRADDWIPTRLSLLSRLRDWDDRDSWEDFFNTYSKLLYNVAVKSGLTDAEAQEVVQETVINVAKKMPTFAYDPAKGSFKGWLLKTAQWRITDQFRRRNAHLPLQTESHEDGGMDPAPTAADASHPEALQIEAQWDDLWTKNLLETALERVKQVADPREFQMFDLAVQRGLTPANVAVKLNVTRAHVYYARYKISRLLRRELQRLEQGNR